MRITKILKDFKWSYIFIEIFVITVGIFVALQIDRWKESSDKNERELKILRELKSSLDEDRRVLYLMQTRYNNVIDCVTKLERHLFLKKEYNDSLQDYAIKATYGFRFRHRNGVYENLKFHGIDLISNDSIKHKILTLYDFDFPRTTDMITSSSDERIPPYIQDKFTHELFLNDKGEIEGKLIISKEAFKEKQFLDYVSDRRNTVLDIKSRFESLLNKVEKLIKDIDEELSTRK